MWAQWCSTWEYHAALSSLSYGLRSAALTAGALNPHLEAASHGVSLLAKVPYMDILMNIHELCSWFEHGDIIGSLG